MREEALEQERAKGHLWVGLQSSGDAVTWAEVWTLLRAECLPGKGGHLQPPVTTPPGAPEEEGHMLPWPPSPAGHLPVNLQGPPQASCVRPGS